VIVDLDLPLVVQPGLRYLAQIAKAIPNYYHVLAIDEGGIGFDPDAPDVLLAVEFLFCRAVDDHVFDFSCRLIHPNADLVFVEMYVEQEVIRVRYSI
jgi:hypothetical protein